MQRIVGKYEGRPACSCQLLSTFTVAIIPRRIGLLGFELNYCKTSADQPIMLGPGAHIGLYATNEAGFASSQCQKRRWKIICQCRKSSMPRDVPVTQQPPIVGISCEKSGGQHRSAYNIQCIRDQHDYHTVVRKTFANDKIARFKHADEVGRHLIKSFGAG